ncbi:DUF5054 domain-containing protein [Dictyobacter alpinus]|nr:DUF5054 domain-containing protein [Dictyobacter alpinus]
MQRSHVHLLFKTHLDLGFTELAEQVKQRYFHEYFPKALETARVLRVRGGAERFVWTTGSWILYEYLEQASAQERALMERAILEGDIAWHALPMTMHSELLDASLFTFGLHISHLLDQRFGRQTIAGKMSDVPGHTRAMVPLLAQAGIQFLHIGVNPGSTSPDVPPLFVWRDLATASEVVVMYQPGSYGDLATVPDSDTALAFAHTLDNIGPQNSEQVLAAFSNLRKRLPEAEITASTLDAFARAILPLKAHFPVITDEIGDSWIHGVGSDPQKVGHYRALSRLRRQWQMTGQFTEDDERWYPFSNALLQMAEHTWGMDEKTYLADYTHYNPAQLSTMRHVANFQLFASSWTEQRAYVQAALAALGDTDEAQKAGAALAQLEPQTVALEGFQSIEKQDVLLETRYFLLRVSEQGALTWLQEKQTGRIWATPEQPLALFFYELFSQTEYECFFEQYIWNKSETAVWAREDFTKPGIDQVVDSYQRWHPRLISLYRREKQEDTVLLLQMAMPQESWQTYGAPRTVTVELTFLHAEPVIELTLQWFEKQANRLPEALWFSFQPAGTQQGQWSLHKMGHWISPLEVISHGNRTLHAVERGARYTEDGREVLFETLDAPLVAPGTPSLLDFHNRQPQMEQGLHFNLYNNVWGTNFPMWYEDDGLFRFVLRF